MEIYENVLTIYQKFDKIPIYYMKKTQREVISMKTRTEQKKKLKDGKGFLFYLKRDWQLYVLVAVPLLFAVVFKFLPMLGLSIAFLDYKPIKGFTGSEFIGLDIFKQIFTSKDFYKALRNTLVLNGLDLVAGFPAPIILAILLNEITHKWYKKLTQTVLYLPHFLSWVIIAGLAYQLFSPQSGYINVMLTRLGANTVPFLTEKYHWAVSYVLIGVWQSMGWGTIIYLAAITSISGDLYEAATVDGAGRWRKIWNITLPCLKPTIVVMLIMSLGRIMGSNFERPYTLSNPMVTEFSDVIATYVYRMGLQQNHYNIATAVGLFQSLVGVVLVLGADRFSKLIGEDGIV
jgi:putative aldouronate transport system permease protein